MLIVLIQVFQHRYNGTVDFYRNFSEYVHGFGDLNTEFWLGVYLKLFIIVDEKMSFSHNCPLKNFDTINVRIRTMANLECIQNIAFNIIVKLYTSAFIAWTCLVILRHLTVQE